MPDEIQEEAVPQEEDPQTEEPAVDDAPAVEPEPESRENARIRDLAEENKRLKEDFEQFRYQQLSQFRQPPPQFNQPVFDSDTDSNILKVIEPDKQALTQEVLNLKTQVLQADLRRDNDDFDEIFPDFQKEFQEMMREGFGGKVTAQMAFDAIRARKGVYTKKGQEAAERKQKERAATATPKGGGSAKSEEKSFADMTFEEREQYRERVKAGYI